MIEVGEADHSVGGEGDSVGGEGGSYGSDFGGWGIVTLWLVVVGVGYEVD